MGDQRLWARLVLAGVLASALVLGGCSGDDGDDGITIEGKSAYELAVDNGYVGTEAEWLASLKGTDGTPGSDATATPATALESCALCHKVGGFDDPVVTHETSNAVTFTPGTVTVDGADLVATFNLKLDGENSNGYTSVGRAVVMYEDGGVYKRQAFDRNTDNYTTALTVTNGDYTLRVTRADGTGAAYDPALPLPTVFPGTDARYYFRLGGSGLPNASVSFADPAYQRVDLVSNASCTYCHGEKGGADGDESLFGHHTNPWRAEGCVTCHSPVNPVGYGDFRSSLTAIVHGIHNSHNMPEGYTYNAAWQWDDVTYPTYMQNCSVCHDTPASLAIVNSAPTTYSLCMSCHGDWTGFSFASATAAPFKAYHESLPAGADCLGCHKVSGAAPNHVVASDFHNGLQTGRAGVIWNGQDLSVVEGAKVDMQITGVSYPSATTLAVTWTAAYDGAPVNPCNAVAAAGAPAFHAAVADAATGQVASNMSLLRAYGQGDDWVNAGIGTAPGQPVATNLSTTNTQCAANVATTTIDLTAGELATTATKGIVALQGKAQVDLGVDYLPAAGVQSVDQVRSKTPTRQFVVGTGALDTTRRSIVDTAACLKCHVGSLYQHGGNRVDNVDMCVMCHNEASSEQNVRVGDGVDASEAYDGKPGMTYGFKSLLHGVHAAGKTGDIVMCYRTNGIYVWTGADTVIPNWPGPGAQTVFGSNPAGTNPDGTTRTHNLYIPTYPRYLKDCQACHGTKLGSNYLPDQAKSVATTIDAGVAPWGNQLDDKLMGTGAATCVSCHTGAQAKAHASQNGWAPTVFPEGRQTIIDAAN
jgi:OmcA/MtrC family decaheme c-type cytochrome